MKTFFGYKKNQTRVYLENGHQLPITVVSVSPLVVTQLKTFEKDGYQAIQLGIGEKKPSRLNKPTKKHLERAGVKTAPLHVREVVVEKMAEVKPGDQIKVDDILAEGDQVKVAGVSKGRGFTGVMKRWHFAGGPRTHGQSDRPRSPGSIGQGTTPGRVFKGKKMPGRSGGVRIMVQKLTVVKIDLEAQEIWLKGQIPGKSGGLIEITKTGVDKNFVPVLKSGSSLSVEVVAAAKKAEDKKEKEAVESAKNGKKE
ncbi:50S ribosomal protein L3 [Patescibacteria group bacterium]|nr:50S ribosomal protein L3 [Patescibacteria group bacterium]